MEDSRRKTVAIRSFRDLEVYQLARKSAKSLYALSKTFPRDERFALTDQIRRSSRAVGSMIAEAWARRRYPAAFISKLTEAVGEAMETQSWLDSALDCEYFTPQEFQSHDACWQSIGAMLSRMIERVDTFCPPKT